MEEQCENIISIIQGQILTTDDIKDDVTVNIKNELSYADEA